MKLNEFTAVNTFAKESVVEGVTTLEIIKDEKITAFDEPTFIKNVPLAEKSEEDIEKEINNIFDHKTEEKHDEHIESLPPELASSEEYNTYDKPIVEPINSDIIKPQYVEPQEIKEEVKPVEIVKPEVKEEPKVSELGLEKPKVNIDVDSVIVNDKNNDEDFFDDFFGSEDE